MHRPVCKSEWLYACRIQVKKTYCVFDGDLVAVLVEWRKNIDFDICSRVSDARGPRLIREERFSPVLVMQHTGSG